MTQQKYVEKLIGNCLTLVWVVWGIGYEMIGLVSAEPGIWVTKIITGLLGPVFFLKAIIEANELKRFAWIGIGWLLIFSAIFLRQMIWVEGLILIGGYYLLPAVIDYFKYTVATFTKIKKELKD